MKKNILSRLRYPEDPDISSDEAVGEFLGNLRDLIFATQTKAAQHLHIGRTSINRYEKGKAKPQIGYIAILGKLVIEKYDELLTGKDRKDFLGAINEMIFSLYSKYAYFSDWNKVVVSANEYIEINKNVKSATKAQQDTKSSPAHTVFLSPFELRLQPTAEFVGRKMELQNYAQSLSQQHFAVITGMMDIGKTYLATVLAEQFIASEKNRLFWHSFEYARDFEYLMTQLAHFLSANGDQRLSSLLTNRHTQKWTIPLGENAVDIALQSLKKGGYLICLDDFQFVEEDRMIKQFAEQLFENRITEDIYLLVTSRNTPAFVPFERRDTIHPLEGIQEGDMLSLFKKFALSPLSDEWMQKLYAITEGYPYILTLAIQLIKKRRHHASAIIQNLSQVKNIRRYLLEELDKNLTPQQQAVMHATAVLGTPSSPKAIEAVADSTNVRRSIESLAAQHLLKYDGGDLFGDKYWLNTFVKDFYYELTDIRQNQAMHASAGSFYEQIEPDLLKSAFHYVRSSQTSNAVRLALQIAVNDWGLIYRGQSAMLRVVWDALTADDFTDRADWARILLTRGRLAMFRRATGDMETAVSHFENALHALKNSPNTDPILALRAEICVNLGELLKPTDTDAARTWLIQAQEHYRPLEGDENYHDLAAQIYLRSGRVLASRDELQDAKKYLNFALSHLPTVPSNYHIEAQINLGNIASWQGNLDEAINANMIALRNCDELGDDFRRITVLNNLGIFNFFKGDWQIARQHWAKAETTAKTFGSGTQRIEVSTNLGTMCVKLGNFDTAQNLLHYSIVQAKNRQLLDTWITASSSMADLHIQQAQFGKARLILEEITPHAAKIARDQLPEIYRSWAQVSLSQADYISADKYAHQAFTTSKDDLLEQGISIRIAGQIHFAAGKISAALSAFQSSFELLNNKAPYETACTKTEWGHALLAGPDAARGQTMLNQALYTFKELGAQWDVKKVLAMSQVQT